VKLGTLVRPSREWLKSGHFYLYTDRMQTGKFDYSDFGIIVEIVNNYWAKIVTSNGQIGSIPITNLEEV